MVVIDLGTMSYRDAWQRQLAAHDDVVAGGKPVVFLVEHPPVITLGRQTDKARANVLLSQEQLARRGIELVESDRGGNVTFHGPGQLVMYPILKLNEHRLSVGAYMKLLEHTVIESLGQIGIQSQLNEKNIGVWTQQLRGSERQLAKICAMGVRVKRGVTMHGLALNVTTDLNFFSMIVPCGLAAPVTSVSEVLGNDSPTMGEMKGRIIENFRRNLDKIRRAVI